jgi:hypothetical protein
LPRTFLLAMVALILIGASHSVSTIIHGRITSVTNIFFKGGPQSGEIEVGVVPQLFGSPAAIIIGGDRDDPVGRLDYSMLAKLLGFNGYESVAAGQPAD